MKRLVFALLLAGCQQTGLPTTAPEPAVNVEPVGEHTTPGLVVVANDPRKLDGKGVDKFHLSTVRELYLRLWLPAVPAPLVWVKVTLHNPNGAVYIQRWVPFTDDPTLTETQPRAGQPGPVVTYPMAKLKDGVGLDYAIVVGGSNLVKRPMPGLWRLRAEVDGYPDLAAERTLELTMAPPPTR
jgi:hypothetical protein